MTDGSTYQALRDVFKNIDEVVANDTKSPDAQHLLSILENNGGCIDTLEDEISVNHTTEKEVSETFTSSIVTNGVDGSTTRDIRFNNGLIVVASVAKSGNTGKNNPDDKSSISVIFYYPNAELNVPEPETNQDTTVVINQFPDTNQAIGNLSNWMNTISRTYAESLQLSSVARSASNPIFLDGPIFPVKVLSWVMYDQAGLTRTSPMSIWSSIINKVMQNYIDSIEAAYVNSIPLFGIQKSTRSRTVIDDIKEKSSKSYDSDFPYNNDGQLFSSALSQGGDTNGKVSYTDWFVYTKYRLDNKQKIKPFDSYKKLSTDYNPIEYERAVFFVQPQNKNTVFRVSTPRICFGNPYTPREMQEIALSTLSEQRKEPRCITLADSNARISKRHANELRTIISMGDHISRQERRVPDD